MNKNDISIQLYTVRNFQPYSEIFNFFFESGITNIELFGLESLDIEDFNNIIGSYNISSKSSHFSFEALDEPLNIIERAKKMNIQHVIVPAPPIRGDNFKDQFSMNEEDWTIFGKNLSSYVSIFEDFGLTLGYHNHSYEFIPLPSGKLPIECIMDHNDNLKFEIDLGWAIAGGVDPNPWIMEYSKKIIACHLKDFFDKDKDMLDHNNQSAVGDGFIDWKKIINCVKQTNCELFILEHDNPKDYKDYTLRSLKNLRDI